MSGIIAIIVGGSILMCLFIWAMYELTENEYKVQELENELEKKNQELCEFKTETNSLYRKMNEYGKLGYLRTIPYRMVRQVSVEELNHLYLWTKASKVFDVEKEIDKRIVEDMFREAINDPQFRGLWDIEKEDIWYNQSKQYKLQLNIAHK